MAETLISRVRSLSKSAVAQTSDNILLDFIRDYLKTILTSIPEPLIWNIKTELEVTDDNGGLLLNESTRILSIFRNGYPSKLVGESMIPHLKTAGSLFYPTNVHPKHFIEENSIFVKPAPTAPQPAKIFYIDMNAEAGSLTTVSTKTNVASIDGIVILFAASKDAMSVASYWRAQGETELSSLDGDMDTSLGNFNSSMVIAEDFINGVLTTDNAIDKINDDDSEMTQSLVQTAEHIVNEAKAFLAEAQLLSGKNANIASYFANYTNAIQHSVSLYNQAQSQLAMLVGNFTKSPEEERPERRRG